MGTKKDRSSFNTYLNDSSPSDYLIHDSSRDVNSVDETRLTCFPTVFNAVLGIPVPFQISSGIILCCAILLVTTLVWQMHSLRLPLTSMHPER